MEIITNTSAQFQELSKLVSSFTESEFVSKIEIIGGSTIGQHVRHILEFYIELDKGYESKIVSYDDRERRIEFETNQALIISKLNHLSISINTYDIYADLEIESNHGMDETKRTRSKSSVMRELVYALDHTVHHLAIIKIAMQIEFPHVGVSSKMGVAPSTLRNSQKICAQ